MRTLIFVALLLLTGVAIFALENSSEVLVKFAWWRWSTTLALAMAGASAAGGLIVYVASLVAQRDLRGRVRAAETRAREAERIRDIERTREVPRFEETQRISQP